MGNPQMLLFIFIVSAIFCGSEAHAMACLAPPRPLVPSDPAQARAFAEAQEVSQEYGRFLESVSKDR